MKKLSKKTTTVKVLKSAVDIHLQNILNETSSQMYCSYSLQTRTGVLTKQEQIIFPVNQSKTPPSEVAKQHMILMLKLENAQTNYTGEYWMGQAFISAHKARYLDAKSVGVINLAKALS